ncbi:MAG: hypothetical protein NTZ16_00480 [Verrucomicrobia bacterium]|nr:hypothetical protein [Verrucomicrobiota bacterium]
MKAQQILAAEQFKMPEHVAPAVGDALGDEVRSRIALRGERFENVLQLVPEREAVPDEQKTLRCRLRGFRRVAAHGGSEQD